MADTYIINVCLPTSYHCKGVEVNMLKINGIKLPLEYTEVTLKKSVCFLLGTEETSLISLKLAKRSLDARGDKLKFVIAVDVEIKDEEKVAAAARKRGHNVQVAADNTYALPPVISPEKRPGVRPVVIGSGPAGLFAALVLADCGLCPVLLERGQPVEQRSQDVNAFFTEGRLNPASNVQFGEGGAGAFSDGKLNTGISNPRCRYILEQLVRFGAPEDILWQSKPHVGTDLLCGVVKAVREEIIARGGEVLFGHRVIDISIEKGRIRGLVVESLGKTFEMDAEQVVLAIGHSARDTLEMLYRRTVPMECKPFAVGVRIEHPRTVIDRSRYGSFAGHSALGAADYKLSCRTTTGRGAYTFCMCPGGYVIAASSEPEMLAVNGMSNHARNAKNSNSALLVGVTPDDYRVPGGNVLDGMEYQRKMERAAFAAGGGDYRAPVQLVGDFLARRATKSLGDVRPSYLPGVTPSDLRECLPAEVAETLRIAIPQLGHQFSGFDRVDAVLTGVESRSSSPVRMSRDDNAMSPVSGLYPCGEGAGYAGGIVSAAVDGVYCAEKICAVYGGVEL